MPPRTRKPAGQSVPADAPSDNPVEPQPPSELSPPEDLTESTEVEAEALTAASMAGLLGDLKVLRDARDTLIEQLEQVASVTNGAMAGLNERVNSLELRLDTGNNASPAIFAAIWGVMNAVQGVGKHGQMEFGDRYSYRKYDDLKRKLGAAFRTHGVMPQSEVVSVVNQHPFEKDPRKARVQVHMRYLFTSLRDGSTVVAEAVGESIDTSDKATGKAQTMALKTALDQAFMLAMEDIEDPDATRPGEDDTPPAQQRAYDPAAERARAAERYAPEQPVPSAAERASDARTPSERAQAAADRLSRPNLTLAGWTRISNVAQQQELLEVPVRVNGEIMALKHHMVAVGRTVVQ